MSEKQDLDRRALIAGVGGIVAGSLLAAGNARAGQLEPPPGPVQSTRESLRRISSKVARTTSGYAEPRTPVQSLPSSSSALYVISASGSYYLTDNIQGQSGLHGIQVLADNVDIDLGGFHLYGAPPDPTGLPGGSALVSASQNTTVYDGTLIGWQNGADFQSASVFILWDITCIGAISNAFLLGNRGQAYDCDAYSAKGSGFAALGVRSLVEECGAWTCGIGFQAFNSPNIFLSNCATECGAAFQIPPQCSYGPIVDMTGGGDISEIPNSSHPSANFVY